MATINAILAQMRLLHEIQTKTIVEQLNALQTLEEALKIEEQQKVSPETKEDS